MSAKKHANKRPPKPDVNTDMLIRLGVIEKMVDKLADRVLAGEVTAREMLNSLRGMATAVNGMQQNSADEWDTVEAAPTAAPADDLSGILDN